VGDAVCAAVAENPGDADDDAATRMMSPRIMIMTCSED
jgi:hypothetical protein